MVLCPLCHLWERFGPFSRALGGGRLVQEQGCVWSIPGALPFRGKHPACRKTLREASGKKPEAGRGRGSEQERGLHSLFPMAPVRQAQPTRPILATGTTWVPHCCHCGHSWAGLGVPSLCPQGLNPCARHGRSSPAHNGAHCSANQSNKAESRPLFLGAHMLQGKCHFVCNIHLGSRVMKSCIIEEGPASLSNPSRV